ncbi:MAG: molecular chaperone DnaJ [Armatimonadota bacterium]
MLNATFRPLAQWPGAPRTVRRHSQFRAGYVSTLDLLEAELDKLSARDIIIQIAVDRKDIRNDGWPRADARPRHPGVILNFVSRKIPYQFVCDTYHDWQDNLRAIALTLEALRAMERYGATQHREQYKGFAQLPPGEGAPPPQPEAMTTDEAAELLGELGGFTFAAVLADAEVARIAWRRAADKTHPDKGGDGAEFLRAQRAWELLRAHHGESR